MRRIPAVLLDHINQPVTTLCKLLKLTLVDGREFGLTTLDRDVTYFGVVYKSLNGFDASNISASAGLTVDNTEANALLATEITPGITFAMASAGELDNARWSLFLINWSAPDDEGIILDAGDVGQVKITDGNVYTPELISFAMRLKQTIGQVWSRRCRATFGTDAYSQLGCGVDAEGLWTDCVVTAVDPNDRFRVFADNGNIISELAWPARVQWTLGNNASVNRLYQVEDYNPDGGTVGLFEPTPWAIEVGDEYRIRPDCAKSPDACKAYSNFINYKGEPFIPVGDGRSTQTPGAQVFGSL